MKKIAGIFLAVLLVFSMTMSAAATEVTNPTGENGQTDSAEPTQPAGCSVLAESVEGEPGETVTVPIKISQNPGFTNFAIVLDYDREHLTLKSIETKAEDRVYLCGDTVSVNTQWKKSEEEKGVYIVSAVSEPVKEDGILFIAVFEIAADFVGTASVTPIVQYIRSNETETSVFKQVEAASAGGTVTSVKKEDEGEGSEGGDVSGEITGDVNGDGIVEYDDVMLAYKAFLQEITLTPEQMEIVDTNKNSIIEESEFNAVYDIYFGG